MKKKIKKIIPISATLSLAFIASACASVKTQTNNLDNNNENKNNEEPKIPTEDNQDSLNNQDKKEDENQDSSTKPNDNQEQKEKNDEKNNKEESNPYYDKLTNYLLENNFSYFNNFKQNLTNHKESIASDDLVNNIISFLNYYKNILNLEVVSPFLNDENDSVSQEEINSQLKKYDEIVNTNNDSFLSIDLELANKIKATYDKILQRNESIKVENNNYQLFVNKVQDAQWNNQVLANITTQNIKNIYLNKSERESFFNNINLIQTKIDEIINIKEVYKRFEANESYGYKINEIINFIANFDNLTRISDIALKLSDLENELKAIILSNDWIPNDLKSKIINLKNKVKQLENVSQEKIDDLNNSIENVLTYQQFEKVQKEYLILESQIDIKKQELKNKINLSSLSSNNIESLNEIINPIENISSINDLSSNFDTLIQSFDETNSLIQQIQEKINNSQFKNSFALDFYKKLAKWNKLLLNQKLNNINLLNLTESINKINELKLVFSEIINNEATSSDENEDLLTLFKNETQNLWTLNLSENAKKYNLESHATSASIGFEIANILYDKFDSEAVDFEIIDLSLDEINKNKLNITTKVFLKAKPEINYTISSFKVFGNEDINTIVNGIELNNLDQFFNVKYDELQKITQNDFENLTFDEKSKFFEPKSQWIFKYFKIKLNDDFTINNERIFVTFNVMFNNQALKIKNIPTIKKVSFSANELEKQKYSDLIDERKILDIIKGSASNFISQVKIKKGAMYSHIHYLASDAIKAFEELYDLPKFGRYEIFVKDLRNINDWTSSVDLVLWYKKDGVEVPIINEKEVYSNLKRMGSFKPLDFYDVKPINNKIFTAKDFVSENLPEQNIINIINSINESNFKLRLAWGDQRRSTYRSLNVKDMIDQQAFVKMEYVLEIKNGENRRGNNLDDQVYVPLDAALYEKEIEVNSTNIGSLRSNYFTYYYDVQLTGKRGMTFKLGFINKRNNSIRYTTNKEYTLINLVNDFQQTLYPEIMLNNIKLSDLNVDYEQLKTKTVSYFRNNIDELNQIITLKGNENNEITYKNFSLPNSLFKIADIRRNINDETYIRLSVQDKNNNRVLGNTWFKISGFMNEDVDNGSEDLIFAHDTLKTIQDSIHSITRERIIEPYWKDLLWEINKKTNIATWTLKRKYIELTLLKPNAKNRHLSFEVLAGPLINDGSKNARIRNLNNAVKIDFDFDDLLINNYLKFKRSAFNGVDHFNYFIQVYWNETNGIEFKVSMEDNSNKIIIDEPETQAFASGVKFDKSRAFVILPEATKTTIKYTNDLEQEEYGLHQNRFDYNEVDYNGNGQPILFSNDLDFQRDKSVYYPNQNVSFKLHDGYKLNADYLRIRQYRGWNVVDAVYARNALLDGNTFFGTISFLGKVNKDPNDATFYVITNRHVEGGNGWSNFNAVSGSNFLQYHGSRTYSFAPEIVGSNVENYFNFRTSSTNTIYGTPVYKFWSAVQQTSKDGKANNGSRDLVVVVVDLNEKLRQAHRAGNMQVVWKINNLMNMENAKMKIESKIRTISVPYTLELATIGWPGTTYGASVLRRPGHNHDYSYIQFQPNYSQIFTGSGASGSGIFVDDDYYYSTWTSGNGVGRSEGYTYDNRSYNFFGVNWNNENPLELKNFNSVASQIFKANLLHPNKYDLPWFLNADESGDK